MPGSPPRPYQPPNERNTLNRPADLTGQVADVINAAWPCFVHYADPAELVRADSGAALKSLLGDLANITPGGERCYDATFVPPAVELTEDMAHGHEHHPACLALAVAVTRCIPALVQSLTEGTWPGGGDQHAVRHALLAAHYRHHRLDPAWGAPYEGMVEALTSTAEQPVETAGDWQFMVRLTHEVHGGEASALDFMPMRCFEQLEHARNWSLVQAAWDCVLLADGNEMLTDPRHLAIIADIERYDGVADRFWRLPSTHVDLHLTPRPRGESRC